MSRSFLGWQLFYSPLNCLIRWSFTTQCLFLHLTGEAAFAEAGGKAKAELCYLSSERQERQSPGNRAILTQHFLQLQWTRWLKTPTDYGREIATQEANVINNLIAKGQLPESSLVFSPRFLMDKWLLKNTQVAVHKQRSRWKEIRALASSVLIKPVYVLPEWMTACLPGNLANLGRHCRYLNFVSAQLC